MDCSPPQPKQVNENNHLQKTLNKNGVVKDGKNINMSRPNESIQKGDTGHLYRLLLVSSKIRNAIAFQSAILPGVTLIQYRYETSTMESLLGNNSQHLWSFMVVYVVPAIFCL